MKKIILLSLTTIGAIVSIVSCKHDNGAVPVNAGNGAYPAVVGDIFMNRCATAGCHNEASYTGAGGLRLDSWEHLFDGSVNGAVVVPYSSDYSSLMYFINTDSGLGPVAIPTMPLNHDPLTKEEYLAVKKWIDEGAPDKDGNIAFSSEPATRQKVYTIHQGCDMVAVIDAGKNVVMRYISVGSKPFPESAYYTVVSPDGRNAYVSFWFGNEVYKIDTYTDKVVEVYTLNNKFWSAMEVSNDGQQLVLTNGDDYRLAIINTISGQVHYQVNTGFAAPHGITADAAFSTFYVTSIFGNTVYRYTNGHTDTIVLDNMSATTLKGNNTPDPYNVRLSPDGSKYFVSCAGTNDLRVFSSANDSLLMVIQVGTTPQNLSFSKSKPYIFVPCMEDASAGIFKGSVYVINYSTLEVVSVIKGSLYQPHTVAVNDQDNTFYIFSRNQNYDGPAPHHSGPCSGRNGYYQVYDLNTLMPVNGRRYEVLVDPYVSAIRF